MAQAGLWDVDGNGLSKIDDPSTARAILDKVNNMNLATALKVAFPCIVFALLPQSSSTALVLLALLFAGLYAVKDKVPKPYI